MSDLLWPGDARSGSIGTDASVLTALLRVESAWLETDRFFPADSAPAPDLLALAGPDDLAALAVAAEEGGNPVIPLLALLRERLGDDPRAKHLHRGLTSQDVLDTALVL